jgi:probable F420-dependent oxidoreductase
MIPFRFGVNSAIAPSMADWRDRARRAEELGYSALYVMDHCDTQFAPLIAATVAAEATSTLHVGTLVLNNDLRNPIVLAKEIATLGFAAEGRIEVGLGAGWLRSDYEQAGIRYDRPGARVDRLRESVMIMKSLLNEGETTFEGTYYTVHGARCDPRPVSVPRFIIGGGSERVLTLAAEHADIVGITTSTASAERGDAPKQVSLEHFDRCLSWVRAGAGDRFESLEILITVFTVMVVSSRRAAVRSATMLGYSGEQALDLPIILIGTEDELCEQLIARREKWGISNVVVPGESMEAFAPIVAQLNGR